MVAAILTVPLLVGVGDSIGILGGYVIGVTRLDFNNTIYLINSINYLELWDILSGIIKGAVFGCIIALMGCFFGMRCEKGAEALDTQLNQQLYLPLFDPGCELLFD